VEDSGGRGEEEVVLLWAVLEWPGVVAGVDAGAWTAGGAIVVWGSKMFTNSCSLEINK
jgi:hypothetical protein